MLETLVDIFSHLCRSMHPPNPAWIITTSIMFTDNVTTSTITETEIQYTRSYHTTTQTVTSTGAAEAINGGFTETLSQTVDTYTTTYVAADLPVTTSISDYVVTETAFSQIFSTVNASSIPGWAVPNCTLPSSYSSCQAEWLTYASHQVVPFPPPVPTE